MFEIRRPRGAPGGDRCLSEEPSATRNVETYISPGLDHRQSQMKRESRIERTGVAARIIARERLRESLHVDLLPRGKHPTLCCACPIPQELGALRAGLFSWVYDIEVQRCIIIRGNDDSVNAHSKNFRSKIIRNFFSR